MITLYQERAMDLLTSLYGKSHDRQHLISRFNHVYDNFEKTFSRKASDFFSTAGRTELGGNHTDHNLGHVLAGTVNLDIVAAVAPREDNVVTLTSEGFSKAGTVLDSFSPVKSETGTSSALIRGVAAEFIRRGLKVGGFDAYTISSIPKGSGMSSSAAVEVLIGTIFNELYNGGILTPLELARIGQYAENVYYGKPCGLMDQVACANGGIVGIDFLDRANPIITPVSIDFEDYGYSFVIVNTGGSHSNLTNEYAAIPEEMRSVAMYFGKEYMREVDIELFYGEIANLRCAVGNDRAVLRAMHFLEEDRRAARMAQVLLEGNFDEYLSLVNESGSSSFRFLQNVYANCDALHQGIPIALALTEKFLEKEGASRVQGGGFAGTIQAYIPSGRAEKYIALMNSVFGEDSARRISVRNTPTCRLPLSISQQHGL